MIRIGLDVGSTTAKLFAIDGENILHMRYKRHNAQAREAILELLGEIAALCGDSKVSLRITGSVGMGFSERLGVPFVQEVVAAACAVNKNYPTTRTMIDIGGEDAKVVFFKNGEPADLRMNGNCAGGTGAFIDQMAVILGVETPMLDQLASNATRTYPIASRCGVFSKTDIQNLIARNASREDVAASIFHAVAVQTVTTLAHGCDITAPVLMCGGPLSFIPALRKAFADYLSLAESDIILPEHGAMLPAMGAAMAHIDDDHAETLSGIIARIKCIGKHRGSATLLKPIFASPEAHAEWKARMSRNAIAHAALQQGTQDAFIGIDSGSTTTKVVAINGNGEIIFSHYTNNGGNPMQATYYGLKKLDDACRNAGATLRIKGSCSTGYGEDLMKAAFSLDHGIVETIAHYIAANHLDDKVSFILDIGGQDMKAIFVGDGVIDRIELNEACSSGCGSFIETFARNLGYTATQFSQAACMSASPCDLGTRCTVFMNSKVKQVMREGASVEDIAAGLAYSVVKNCLYKVLKLKDASALGKHIVVQGGTMRNDAIVRALELLTGAEVTRCDCPELMGAYGCALYAMQHSGQQPRPITSLLAQASYTTADHNCHGCENQCQIHTYIFAGGKRYHSGNRCEKVFNNSGQPTEKGENAYRTKNRLLFSRQRALPEQSPTVGIPRVLNIYEEYPFWHTLFTDCGIQVKLSDASDFSNYEKCAHMVMSDNICFPAKVVHSHIESLQKQGVERIFMPFVVHEHSTKGTQNSYNCPIVTGYSTVVKSSQPSAIPIDSPTISFRDTNLLTQQCSEYLTAAFGINPKVIARAVVHAEQQLAQFHADMAHADQEILQHSRSKGRLCIMLAGRPYHADPLIQHRVSDLLAGMGIDVITDDIVRLDNHGNSSETHYLAQWAYPNRILKAAEWCASQGDDLLFVQMTSFGCGPDAFLNDEVRDFMLRHHKAPTLLKLDDINNAGSMKLRIRSLVESLNIARKKRRTSIAEKGFVTTPAYDKACRNRKILVPFFTPFISPLIPSVLRLSGYEVENLPMSDRQSCEWGLKYANNEVCYPATLIVGDIIKAFRSGQHLPDKSAVAITQTGGQCRASNYVLLIKKALVDAGYPNVPVISLTFGDELKNDQPAFKINWAKLLPVALRAILYSDCISKLYHAAAVREKIPGQAQTLAQLYLQRGAELIEARHSNRLIGCIADAATEFDNICTDMECPRVGIVGEIFLKFNPFAQKDVIGWLIGRHIEVMPPLLLDFFMQSFVNRRANVQQHIDRRNIADTAMPAAYKIVKSAIEKFDKAASRFRYYRPFNDIFAEAEAAKQVITLAAQFGEGWLLPAEVISFAKHGVNNVISLQPFGCIANHIVSKGVEKRIKNLFPDINLLSLDFDSGVSDVNITNRLLLFTDKLKQHEYNQ